MFHSGLPAMLNVHSRLPSSKAALPLRSAERLCLSAHGNYSAAMPPHSRWKASRSQSGAAAVDWTLTERRSLSALRRGEAA
jgi:hypothetical protein